MHSSSRSSQNLRRREKFRCRATAIRTAGWGSRSAGSFQRHSSLSISVLLLINWKNFWGFWKIPFTFVLFLFTIFVLWRDDDDWRRFFHRWHWFLFNELMDDLRLSPVVGVLCGRTWKETTSNRGAVMIHAVEMCARSYGQKTRCVGGRTAGAQLILPGRL